jgi:hypothetical protein
LGHPYSIDGSASKESREFNGHECEDCAGCENVKQSLAELVLKNAEIEET